MSDSSDFEIPQISFWSDYNSIKQRMKLLKRKISVPSFQYDPCNVCADIEEKILEREEETILSCLQNKIRKLDAGTDLCRDICDLQRCFTQLAINNTVSEILEEEKYNEIANKITEKQRMERRTEEFFKTQAINAMKRYSALGTNAAEEHTEENEQVPIERQENQLHVSESATEINGLISRTDDPPRVLNTTGGALSIAHNGESALEIDRGHAQEIIYPELTLLVESAGNVDLARGRPSEVPSLPNVTVPMLEEQNADRESREQNIDVAELTRTLEEAITQLPNGDIAQHSENAQNGHGSSEMGELLPLDAVPQRRRRPRRVPIIDTSTSISNYSRRARILNHSTNIQRVTVYDGPPSLIESFRSKHYMTSSGVLNHFSSAQRSSALENLFNRHLITEEVAEAETISSFPQRVSVAQEPIEVAQEDVISSRVPQSEAIRPQLLDAMQISNNLPKSRELEVEKELSVEEKLERLFGTPVARLLQRSVTPPLIPNSEPWLPPRSPRTQNLSGTTINEPTTDPWFMPVYKPAPSQKWREFKFVRNCLQKIWRQREEEGLDKSIGLMEILKSENESTGRNFLTLLRVLDKMSLKNEVVLAGSGQDIVAQPFEVPYVSEKLFALRREQPNF